MGGKGRKAGSCCVIKKREKWNVAWRRDCTRDVVSEKIDAKGERERDRVRVMRGAGGGTEWKKRSSRRRSVLFLGAAARARTLFGGESIYGRGRLHRWGEDRASEGGKVAAGYRRCPRRRMSGMALRGRKVLLGAAALLTCRPPQYSMRGGGVPVRRVVAWHPSERCCAESTIPLFCCNRFLWNLLIN